MSIKDINSSSFGSDDREFNNALSELDWDIEPERDLWPDISSRIRFADKRRKHQAQSTKPWVPYAMAASTVIAVVSLVFSSMSYQYAQDSKKQQAVLVQFQQAQLELIDQQHRMVRTQFVAMLAEQDINLTPEFVAEVTELMTNIDSAAAEIKNALLTQPNNPNYTSMLVTTYQQELKLLNRVKSSTAVSI